MSKGFLSSVVLAIIWSCIFSPTVAGETDKTCKNMRDKLNAIYAFAVPDKDEEHDNNRYFYRDENSNLAPNWASLVCPRAYDGRRSLNIWHPLGEAPADFIEKASQAANAVYQVSAKDMFRDIKHCLLRAKKDSRGNSTGQTGGITYSCGYGELNSESNILFDPR